MIKIRETSKDRIKQTKLFDVFSEKRNLKFKEFSPTNKKYRIDGYCHDENGNVICWVECKWYESSASLLLNITKFLELKNLSEASMCPSYLLFREGDYWGYIEIHDGINLVCNYVTKIMGGTPEGREPNDDDIEPLIKLNKKNIVWGNK